MTFRTPSGRPASRKISSSFRAVRGVSSAGLRTALQPGGRDLEHRDEEGPVPGNDEADDADRLELGEGVVRLVMAE
jgi:hypothetical protein